MLGLEWASAKPSSAQLRVYVGVIEWASAKSSSAQLRVYVGVIEWTSAKSSSAQLWVYMLGLEWASAKSSSAQLRVYMLGLEWASTMLSCPARVRLVIVCSRNLQLALNVEPKAGVGVGGVQAKVRVARKKMFSQTF